MAPALAGSGSPSAVGTVAQGYATFSTFSGAFPP
jgi:hypothetical protein